MQRRIMQTRWIVYKRVVASEPVTPYGAKRQKADEKQDSYAAYYSSPRARAARGAATTPIWILNIPCWILDIDSAATTTH